MQNNKYIMVGTPILTKEIFRNILRPLDNYNYKPSGGLWSCKFHEYEISPWYTYLQDARSITWYKDINHASLFTLKDSSKILEITTYEKLQEIIKKYPSYHHILNSYKDYDKNICFDFKAVSKEYDCIIINPFDSKIYLKTDIFKNWSVCTLLLFNLDCIKEYQSVDIDWDPEYRNSFPEIENISSPKLIQEKTKSYIKLYSLAESLFIEFLTKNKDKFFRDYNEYLENLIEIANKVINAIINSNNIELLELTEKYTNQKLKIEKLTIIRNIILNILSEYLYNDKDRIVNLPKSSHAKIKQYSI